MLAGFVLLQQFIDSFPGIGVAVGEGQALGSLPETATAANTVLAYEPVWAIGTGRTPSVAEVQDVRTLLRGDLAKRLGGDEASRLRVLYGGSVKPDNARALMSLPDVAGALVGGASLKAEHFWAIAQSCIQYPLSQ